MTETLMEKIENLDNLDDPFEFDLQDMVEYAPAPFVAPETVRFNQDQKAIVPFTSSSARIPLHYIDDEDCRGYVHCNGEDDCIACKAGRKVVERILLPVYLPVEKQVGYLSISLSMKPDALLPKLLPYISKSSPKDVVLFVMRDGYKHSVKANKLTDDTDRGEDIVKRFIEARKQGLHNPADLFRRMSNEELLWLPNIREIARLKGLA